MKLIIFNFYFQPMINTSLLKVFHMLDVSKLQIIRTCIKNGHWAQKCKLLASVMLWTLLLFALVIRWRGSRSNHHYHFALRSIYRNVRGCPQNKSKLSLSLKNTKFEENLEFIYLRELEIKATMETAASSWYWDCYLYIDNGKLSTRYYDKRDDFNFPIVNFPFMSSNIPSAPVYGVCLSQLIRYVRACSNYQDFTERESAHYKVVEPGVSKKPNW